MQEWLTMATRKVSAALTAGGCDGSNNYLGTRVFQFWGKYRGVDRRGSILGHGYVTILRFSRQFTHDGSPIQLRTDDAYGRRFLTVNSWSGPVVETVEKRNECLKK